MNITAVTPAQVLHAVESRDRQCRCQGYPEEPFTRPAPPLGQPKASATPGLTNAKSLLDELRSGRRTMETICQSVSVDPRRTTADSMVGRVVASHLVVLLTRAIGSVLVVLPREKSGVVQVFG